MFIATLAGCDLVSFFFFFNDTATTEIYTLSLHDALPIFATAIGESAIGVIRVSGPDAIAIVAPLLRTAIPLEAFPSHRLRRVAIVDAKSGERVDEALCTVMRAPRSYTAEDVVELSCHGSPALLRLVTLSIA